jgi:hypothetical protein
MSTETLTLAPNCVGAMASKMQEQMSTLRSPAMCPPEMAEYTDREHALRLASLLSEGDLVGVATQAAICYARGISERDVKVAFNIYATPNDFRLPEIKKNPLETYDDQAYRLIANSELVTDLLIRDVNLAPMNLQRILVRGVARALRRGTGQVPDINAGSAAMTLNGETAHGSTDGVRIDFSKPKSWSDWWFNAKFYLRVLLGREHAIRVKPVLFPKDLVTYPDRSIHV